jgi:cysteine desulfurase
VFFTSGGTEANNWALLGAAEAMRRRGTHIITTEIEHESVLKPMQHLEKQGFAVTYLKPDSDGRVPADAVTEALREDTILVSVMLVNNETGAKQPVSEIAGALRRAGSDALLHTDAVQAFCKIPFTTKTLGADLVTVSAHKIQGPKGAGALFIKRSVKLPPLILGGGQERGARSGTEALPAVGAFGEAARLGHAELAETAAGIREVREYTAERLLEKLPDLRLIGAGDAPHILSISLPGYKSEVLMNALEAEGVSVSKSSACKRGARSHVLRAMHLPDIVIDGTIRVSFSAESTIEEADYFIAKLAEAKNQLFHL